MSIIQNTLNDYFKRHPLPKKSVIGVAVSGGADSLCLSHALSEYAKKNNLILKAVTIDHGLRAESSEEARYVNHLTKQWGIPHTTLVWKGIKPKTRVEEKARQKRYDLIFRWCHQNKISHLFLAHHQNDQAETFWERLARGSGLNGLAAMAEYTLAQDVYLCRPFLQISKNDLIKDLKKHKINWCEDAMNQDEAYERVRWRHRQQALSDWGLTPEKIGLSCQRLARVKEALDFYTNRFYEALTDLSPMGFFTVQEQAFLTLPDELKLRVLNKILTDLNPTPVPVSLESMERWLNDYPKSATLGGCVLVRQKGVLFIARESRNLNKSAKITAQIATDWNDFVILSSCPVKVQLGSDDLSLPHLIRKSIPHVISDKPFSISFITGTKKELEKKFALDYKRRTSEVILMLFKGKI